MSKKISKNMYFRCLYRKIIRNKNQKPKFVIFEEKNFRQKISDLIKIKSKKVLEKNI